MRWMDLLYLGLSRRLECFFDGWGDPEVLGRSMDAEWREQPPAPVEIRWSAPRLTALEAGPPVAAREGVFDSPEQSLPPESRRGRVELWTRPDQPARALAVALAPWGDEGFAARRRIFGPIVAQGVDLLSLENPFYGTRRRRGQRAACLRYVSDFVSMGGAAVREARQLLAWGRARGYERVGVVGYSMGGQMAAMTAAMMPDAVHVVSMAPSVSPASVFLDGPLRRDLAWRRLGPQAEDRLQRVLDALSVLRLPPPADPSKAMLLGTRADAIVPPADVAAIGRHWGVHPRWLDDGHVSAVALRRRALAQAVIDTLAR